MCNSFRDELKFNSRVKRLIRIENMECSRRNFFLWDKDVPASNDSRTSVFIKRRVRLCLCYFSQEVRQNFSANDLIFFSLKVTERWVINYEFKTFFKYPIRYTLYGPIITLRVLHICSKTYYECNIWHYKYTINT